MDDRKEYAYVLCVGGKINKLIAKEWWSTEKEMIFQKGAMHAAAYVFKKTAAILVYERRNKEGEVWTFADSCQWGNWYFPQEFIITADNKIHYN